MAPREPAIDEIVRSITSSVRALESVVVENADSDELVALCGQLATLAARVGEHPLRSADVPRVIDSESTSRPNSLVRQPSAFGLDDDDFIPLPPALPRSKPARQNSRPQSYDGRPPPKAAPQLEHSFSDSAIRTITAAPDPAIIAVTKKMRRRGFTLDDDDGDAPTKDYRTYTDATISDDLADGEEETKETQAVRRRRKPTRFFAASMSPNATHRTKFSSEDGDSHYWHSFGERRHAYWLMLHPHGAHRVSWDCFMAVAVVYVMLSIPFQLGFDPDLPRALEILEWTLDSCFLLDLVVNFRTGYSDERGLIQLDPRKSARHYLHEWFIVDFVSALPPVVDLVVAGLAAGTIVGPRSSNTTTGTRFLRAMRALRGFKLVKVIKLLVEGTHQSNVRDVLDDLLASDTTKLVFKVASMFFLAAVAAHLLACFFAVSGDAALRVYEPDDRHKSAINWSKTRQYVVCFYWAFSTMTTVGYGDISAVSHRERMYVIAAMFVGSAFYSYVIAIAASIVAGQDAKKATYLARMDTLNAWMSHHHFCSALRRRLRRYFRRRFERRTVSRSLSSVC